MGLDGIMYQGQNLKLRRPKDYVSAEGDNSFSAPIIPGVISTAVADTPYKIFIGGLPLVFNEDQVCSAWHPLMHDPVNLIARLFVCFASRSRSFCWHLALSARLRCAETSRPASPRYARLCARIR